MQKWRKPYACAATNTVVKHYLSSVRHIGSEAIGFAVLIHNQADHMAYSLRKLCDYYSIGRGICQMQSTLYKQPMPVHAWAAVFF